MNAIQTIEHTIEQATNTVVTPYVGMGATVNFYTDRHACTVVRVSSSGKTITIQRDKAVLVNGFKSNEPDALKCHIGGFCANVQGQQRHSYERNLSGEIYKATIRKDGRWVLTGMKSTRVNLGVRSEHYDFNF